MSALERSAALGRWEARAGRQGILENGASPTPDRPCVPGVGAGRKAGGRHQVLLSLRPASPTRPGGSVAALAGGAATADSAMGRKSVGDPHASAERLCCRLRPLSYGCVPHLATVIAGTVRA